eukprot:Protomagalhaensia_wolfi_Nauph_80__1714@NODE_2065_length_1227_cov_18_835017_g1613_i0_p1_GENE_NODE_2065_length_1227_cov_18_835017_g1613_i0NODE_2065_length_1227_cov_18_835017_g1613_i0_p1_ORF_typecomplete_len298_score34_25_NODE_2065_length_1227_cov_18_835017_g1613_i082975
MGGLVGRPSASEATFASPDERQRLLPSPPNDFAKPPTNTTLNTAVRWLPGRIIGYGCGLYSIASALYSLQHLSVYRNQFFHDSTVTLMAPDTYTVLLDSLFSLANLALGVSCLIGTARKSPAWIDRSIKICYAICASEGVVRPAVGAVVAEHGMATFSRGVTTGGTASVLELCSKPLPAATMAYLLEKVKQHILEKQGSQQVKQGGFSGGGYGPPGYPQSNHGNYPGDPYAGGGGGYQQPNYGYPQGGGFQNEGYPNAPPGAGWTPPQYQNGQLNHGYQPQPPRQGGYPPPYQGNRQ